jgi:cellulose synthase/poly-beta-1,6-N-acetylglucosamine synthase-like glycosyltransferase
MGVKAIAALSAAVLALVSSGHGVPRLKASPADAAGLIRVGSDGDLQAALDHAQPGQTLVLEGGRRYEGPFRLPNKDGAGGITIRGDRDVPRRSAPGRRRASPRDAAAMPALVAADGPVIQAEPGAHHYRLEGLEIAPAPGAFLTTLIDLGTSSSQPAAVPHDFVLERLYVHGDPVRGARRGLALNSASTVVADSYFADFKEEGNDSQAICGWNGPGPYQILNNHLEAAGENLMFGGGDPTLENLVPSDIEIRGNELVKPVSWRAGSDPGEPRWTVKNLLELKNARRVTIDGNVLEHTWTAAQVGFAVLFTPRNQDGGAPWSVVEDVTFTNNIVRHVAGGVHLLGWDDIHESRQLQRVRISNNVFEDVGGTWGSGRLFQLISGTRDVTIDHNTAEQTAAAVVGGDTMPHTGFVFENNIVAGGGGGIVGSGTAAGQASIDRYFPGARIRGNVLVGGGGAKLPPDNFAAAAPDDVGFDDPRLGNFRLSASSPFRGRGTDGRDPGVDLDALARAMGELAVPRRVAGSGGGTLAAIFWAACALIGYAYVGYPVLLWGAGRTRPRSVRRARAYPFISIVVVAHNEASRIRRRVENLRSLTYPAERREIVVVSDGSTDETVREARSAGDGVRVVDNPDRAGKAAVFNQILPALQGEIVVLADARQRFAPDAVDVLVSDFADPDVGAVSGQLVLASEGGRPGGVAQGAGFYWRYETWIRYWESRCDSSVGVTGAITALRRSLFEHLPADTVLDDLLIPLRIIRRGYRVAFEPRARAFDGLPVAGRDEFARKVRTLAGNFQLFAREPWLLWPRHNRLWVQTLSHKALRLALPLLFATTLVTNLLLAGRAAPLYLLMLFLQIGFYGLALAAHVWPGLRRRARWMVVPYTICFLSWATVVAFIRFAQRGQSAAWEQAAVSEPV